MREAAPRDGAPAHAALRRKNRFDPSTLRQLVEDDTAHAEAQFDARHEWQWGADADAYDASLQTSRAMAALLGKGLAEQFPNGTP